MTHLHTIERKQFVPKPLKEVFAFFATPENLARLTPRSLDFQIMTPPPIEMKAGTVFDYQIRLAGLPVRWTTLIDTYDPPHRFVDVQIKGPYSFWHHTHIFREIEGGTEVSDRVVYSMPFGVLGNLINSVWVRKDLDHIFSYRMKVIGDIFK